MLRGFFFFFLIKSVVRTIKKGGNRRKNQNKLRDAHINKIRYNRITRVTVCV